MRCRGAGLGCKTCISSAICYQEKIVKQLDIEVKRIDGLIEKEGEIMDNLAKAWNGFIELNKQHPSDTKNFCDGIHECQNVLFRRILRRDYPKAYPTYGEEKYEN
jgi:hypothetical protein